MSQSTILSPEEMKRINDEALAAVERGRAMLSRSRELREQLGNEDEQIETVLGSLPTYSRTLMNRFVGVTLADMAGSSGAPKSGGKVRKKTRQMV